ncbi:hypothetical protein PCANC_26402, partial [Puccinia coronata f. sp. avenae]
MLEKQKAVGQNLAVLGTGAIQKLKTLPAKWDFLLPQNFLHCSQVPPCGRAALPPPPAVGLVLAQPLLLNPSSQPPSSTTPTNPGTTSSGTAPTTPATTTHHCSLHRAAPTTPPSLTTAPPLLAPPATVQSQPTLTELPSWPATLPSKLPSPTGNWLFYPPDRYPLLLAPAQLAELSCPLPTTTTAVTCSVRPSYPPLLLLYTTGTATDQTTHPVPCTRPADQATRPPPLLPTRPLPPAARTRPTGRAPLPSTIHTSCTHPIATPCCSHPPNWPSCPLPTTTTASPALSDRATPPSCSYTQRALPLTKLLTLSLAPVRPTKLPAHHLFYPPDLSPLLLARAQPAELPCPLP